MAKLLNDRFDFNNTPKTYQVYSYSGDKNCYELYIEKRTKIITYTVNGMKVNKKFINGKQMKIFDAIKLKYKLI